MERGFDTIPREVLESASIDGAINGAVFGASGFHWGFPALYPPCRHFWMPERHRTTDDFFGISTILATVPLLYRLGQIGYKQPISAMVASLWMLLPDSGSSRFGQTYLEAGLTKGAVKG